MHDCVWQTYPYGWPQYVAASPPMSHWALQWFSRFPVGKKKEKDKFLKVLHTQIGIIHFAQSWIYQETFFDFLILTQQFRLLLCNNLTINLPTLSLSMASSLAGLKMRSWRLPMDPARLDRADSEGEGLIPVIALDTVERSPLWLTAWRLFTKFL